MLKQNKQIRSAITAKKKQQMKKNNKISALSQFNKIKFTAQQQQKKS